MKTIAIRRDLTAMHAFDTENELYWFMRDHENKLDEYIFSTLGGDMTDETEDFISWYQTEKEYHGEG